MSGSARALAAFGCVAAFLATTACTGGPTPAPATPSFVVDDAAVNQARYECLIDKGFAVTRGEGGSVVFVDPKDKQFAAYQQASRECEQQLVDRGLLPPTHTENLRQLYGLMSDAHACLLAAGFPLKPWPSEESFIDNGGEGNLLEATRPVDPVKAKDACPAQFAALEAAS